VQFLQCQRWPQVRRALPITDAAPRRVPPVSGWDGARSLARAHCVPAPRRRGTGPRQTPLGHRRRRGAIIIIRSAAARRLCCLFFLFRFFVFPAQGQSRPVSRGHALIVFRRCSGCRAVTAVVAVLEMRRHRRVCN